MAQLPTNTQAPEREAIIVDATSYELLNFTHIIHPGPQGGRPRERAYRMDDAGFQAFLERLPPADRVRMQDGREMHGRGGGVEPSVDAVLPVMTTEAVQLECYRRQHNAILDDMAALRRSAVELTTSVLKNANDQIKIQGQNADILNAQLEKLVEATDRYSARTEGDFVDKMTSVITDQMGPMFGQLLRGAAAAKG